MGFFLYIGITMYTSNKTELAILLGITAILGLLFFDKYYNYQLRKLHSKIVKNTYAKRIGEKETMEFTSEYIITEDKAGEGKMKISEVEKINETQANFFIRLSNGAALIISKKGIDNLEEIKNKWKELKIPISENLSWK
ncbi:YcxB family protein [uncultured Kordia sp.]|uniref:YcxB family protein n=1 Tax=uncultured Kordia sp. TaxID=507699 RepID=UPI00261708C6|nr:YcxB family protein [uncultured Kordia sp.]